MGWVDQLHGSVVGLDTAPLIYFIEEHQTYLPLVRPFFEAVDQGKIQVVTSVLTLTEVLIHPLRRGDRTLADAYRRILLSANQVTTIRVSEAVAEEAAQLRSRYGLRTPDAIQLATAILSGARSFLTNDDRLPGAISSIKIIVLGQIPKMPH
jgi:predicted nucleic acid-binding protein